MLFRPEWPARLRRLAPADRVSNLSRSTGRPVSFVLSLFDTGLAAIRSLGRAGVPVVGLDASPGMPGFGSRFCTAQLCPDPVHEAENLLGFLLDWGRRLDGPAVLFPASDSYVLFVSRHRRDLSEYFRFALPEPNVVETILDKRCQYHLAQKVGIPCPLTFYPETPQHVQRIKLEVDYPAFIKPCSGHLWREVFGGTLKGFKVQTPDELEARATSLLARGIAVVVQSIIPGPNTNHFKVCAYFDHRGQPLAVFTLRKIRQYPTEFGVGSLVESVRYPELQEAGLRFLQAIDYRGIGSIEFKRDDRDGQLKLIELNPRLWQQNGQATSCGVNFPLIQYLDLTGTCLRPMAEFTEGVRWLDAVADFQAFWDYFRRGQLSPWAWGRSVLSARTFATFALDDPWPFLTANEFGLKYLRMPLYIAKHKE